MEILRVGMRRTPMTQDLVKIFAVRVLSKLLKNMITPEGLTKETGHGTSLSYTN
jgi:hypothetical protein